MESELSSSVSVDDMSMNFEDLSDKSGAVVKEGVLMIRNIQKTNEGTFMCKVENGVGSELTAIIKVRILGKA